MTLGTTLPYGLRDVKITPLNADETLGVPLDLPNSRTFTFNEAESYENLTGDDRIVTVRGSGPSIEWELEGGGTSLDIVSAMYGHELTDTGTTPTQRRVARKFVTTMRPFFQVEGQAISENGGDFHAKIYKCRASGNLEGEFQQSNFHLFHASGQGFARETILEDGDGEGQDIPAGVLYDLVQNETEQLIVGSDVVPPGAPRSPSGTPGDTEATISWTAPVSNGGASILGYLVTSDPGGHTATVGNVTEATVTGLTNGVAYTFQVRARNLAGYGAASVDTAAVTPTSE